MQNVAIRTDGESVRCGCIPRTVDHRLVIDATECPNDGQLSTSPGCRESAIAAVTPRTIVVLTRLDDRVVVHTEGALGLLVAAARFVALVESDDRTLAKRARRDPLGTAHEAIARHGRVAELAAITGLAVGTSRVMNDEAAFGNVRELNSLTSAGITDSMLHDIDDAGELAPEGLRARYDDRLRAVIDERGVETVAAESGVDETTALAHDDSPPLTLERAAAILETSEKEPDADAIVTETRNALLLGMTTAVLDVEAVESGLNGDLDAREIQQKIEGRLPMDLDELAAIHGYIESRNP